MRICRTCNIEKAYSDFYRSHNGFCLDCKTCHKEKGLLWRKNNPEASRAIARKWHKVNPEKSRSCRKNWQKHNPEKLALIQKKYVSQNREKVYAKNKRWYLRNKESVKNTKRIWEKANRIILSSKKRAYWKNRMEKEPFCKALRITRCRIRLIKGMVGRSGSSLIGCSTEELRNHIQSYFLPGMNWNNHGPKGWHYDHFFPLSKCKNEEELARACHYTNLRPMWSKDNLIKGNKIPTGATI